MAIRHLKFKKGQICPFINQKLFTFFEWIYFEIKCHKNRFYI